MSQFLLQWIAFLKIYHALCQLNHLIISTERSSRTDETVVIRFGMQMRSRLRIRSGDHVIIHPRIIALLKLSVTRLHHYCCLSEPTKICSCCWFRWASACCLVKLLEVLLLLKDCCCWVIMVVCCWVMVLLLLVCCAFCTVVSSTMNLSILFFRFAKSSAPVETQICQTPVTAERWNTYCTFISRHRIITLLHHVWVNVLQIIVF